MTYRIEFGGGAQIQFHSLPVVARDALIERATDLAEEPWDNVTARAPGDDPSFRETLFGSGHGLLGFYVDDVAHLIKIFDIVWIG